MYKLQNVTFEISETFGITNVQIQLIPFYQSGREERIFEIIMFYFEIRWVYYHLRAMVAIRLAIN